MHFTRFIRKVFATKIMLSGKFSFFLTLVCPHCDKIYRILIVQNTDADKMLRVVRSEIISRQGKYPFALSSENMALESDILVKLESANAVVGKRCTFGPNYQVSPTITKRQTFPESCSH